MRTRRLVFSIIGVLSVVGIVAGGVVLNVPGLGAANLMDRGESEGLDDDGQEVEYHGTVQAFSAAELVLDDGRTFVIDQRTDVESPLQAGMAVEVEALASDGELLAVEIEADDAD